MNKVLVEADVGYFVTETLKDGFPLQYYELDSGSNCYGEIEEFYRDRKEDKIGGGICYIAGCDCPRQVYVNSEDFKDHAYTYDDVLEICEGNREVADFILEKACGYHIETYYEEYKMYEDEEEE